MKQAHDLFIKLNHQTLVRDCIAPKADITSPSSYHYFNCCHQALDYYHLVLGCLQIKHLLRP